MPRYPRPKLLRERPADSPAARRLREARLPDVVWQRLFLVALARLERMRDPFAAPLTDHALDAVSTVASDQAAFYAELLDTLERWAPGNKYGLNLHDAYASFRYVRDGLVAARADASTDLATVTRRLWRALRPAGTDDPVPDEVADAVKDQAPVPAALEFVAQALTPRTTARSLRTQFSQAKFGLHSSEMWEIPNDEPLYYDFDVKPRSSRSDVTEPPA